MTRFPIYRPHLVVRDGLHETSEESEYLGIEFVEGPTAPVRPGDRVRAIVRLAYEPKVSYAALTEGAAFDIREGERTVGTGVVVRRYRS